MDIIPKKATGKPGGQIPLAVAGKSGERVKNELRFSGWDFDLLHSFVREQTHRPLLASHKLLIVQSIRILLSKKNWERQKTAVFQDGILIYCIVLCASKPTDHRLAAHKPLLAAHKPLLASHKPLFQPKQRVIHKPAHKTMQ